MEQAKLSYTDKEIEDLWRELSDVPMVEDEENDLTLENDWKFFRKGTSRLDIWTWFDNHYSKGVHYLIYELESN